MKATIPQKPKKESPEHVKRHLKEKVFHDFAPKPKAVVHQPEYVGVAQGKWNELSPANRTAMLIEAGVPAEQVVLFSTKPWCCLGFWVRSRVKKLARKKSGRFFRVKDNG